MAPLPQPAHRAHHASESGLTLLELIICVAVLAVLGVLALPGLGSQFERQRLRHAAETLVGDITEARFLAAQRGQTLYVQAQTGPPWCWTVSADSACSCQAAPSCRIHGVQATDHSGIRVQSNLNLQLDPTGTTPAAASTTLQSTAGEALRVDVSLQGRARVCALSGQWPQLPAC